MKQNKIIFLIISILSTFGIYATPSKVPEVLAHRGNLNIGKGTTKPTLTLNTPQSGWTVQQMIRVSGSCSDPTANPIYVNINGSPYYTTNKDGVFDRSFPASKGKNNVVVECKNKGGTARELRTVDAQISITGLKVVLTNDTDGAYTDLHVYEPDGTHVYWLKTKSPSGGVFFLNSEGDSFDKAGFGPYIYEIPVPLPGIYRIDTNYWPGGAVQHTLANLSIILNEGSPTEIQKNIKKPLARPGETVTLAYIIVKGNNIPPEIYVPGRDPKEKSPLIPDELKQKWKGSEEGGAEEDINSQIETQDPPLEGALFLPSLLDEKKNFS